MYHRLFAISLIAVGLSGSACRGAVTDCPPNKTLVDGECLVTCNVNADCIGGELCTAGACQPDPAPISGPDAGTPDQGLGPNRTTLGQVGGAGQIKTGRHVVRLSVGGAPPVGRAQTNRFRITVGPGVSR